jgi:hypothetical protein
MTWLGTYVRVVWWLTTAGLSVALVVAAAWYIRQVWRRRLPPPGFFLPALLIHFFLVAGSFYIYLDPAAAPQIQRHLTRMVVSTRTSLAGLRRLFKGADDRFEQVADLNSLATEGVAVGPGAAGEAPQLPPPDPGAAPPLPPAAIPRRLGATGFVAPPGDWIASADPRPDHALGGAHRPAAVAMADEPVAIEPLQAAPRAADERIERLAVAVQRPRPAARPEGYVGGAAGVMPGPAPGPSSIPLLGATGRGGGGADVSPETFAPLTMAQLPRLDRARRVPGVAGDEERAESVALAGPATASGQGAGTAAGGGAGNEAAPGGYPAAVRVDVARRELGPAAPGGYPAAGPGGYPAFFPPGLGPRAAGGSPGSGSGVPQGDARKEIERQLANLGPPSAALADGLPRRGSRASSVLDIHERVGLQAMFRLRQDDLKGSAVAELGGSEETIKAVRQGLDWLTTHQHDDGHWSLDRFYKEPKGRSLPGKGWISSDTAATGFALLPLLADGHTHQAGQHRQGVQQALEWLLRHQKPDGELNVQTGQNTRMYAHAIATIALCEAYGMTRDAALRDPAQRAVDFILRSQHRQSGGWRYEPRTPADTSVVGWQVMALKSAQMALLDVPPEPLALVLKWLRSVEGKGKELGTFRYQAGSGLTPAMTAEGLLCLQYLGAPVNDPSLQAGVEWLLKHLPKQGSETSYYWYYGTQVMYHLQGPPWQQWNRALRDMLVRTQHKDGDLAGTWDPHDQWENQAGRIYSTSLRLLMLEVYYRHLPLYQLRQP